MIYNYHTHTYRCGHASGKPEEYIKRAIRCGIKYMGFSDHMPYICSNGFESSYRVPVCEVREYFSELDALRKKYLDKIDIKIGFEMEYYPDKFNGMLENAIGFGAEYLILGAHYVDEELPKGVHTITETDCIETLRKYVNCVVDGIKSKVFTYIAHPDMINFIGDEKVYQREIRKICTASKEYDVPLEINFLGIRDNRNYPNETFWEIAGQEKSPVTFGFDAHDVKSAFDKKSLNIAMEIVRKNNLNYIDVPKVIPIQELKREKI